MGDNKSDVQVALNGSEKTNKSAILKKKDNSTTSVTDLNKKPETVIKESIENLFGDIVPIEPEEPPKSLTDEEVKEDMTNKEHTIFEDEGEDLPENFFDDFSNTDFMDGLDIVDDWIDDGIEDKADVYIAEDVEKNKKSTDQTRNIRSPIKHYRSPHRHHRDRFRHEGTRGRYNRWQRINKDDDRFNRDTGRSRNHDKSHDKERSRDKVVYSERSRDRIRISDKNTNVNSSEKHDKRIDNESNKKSSSVGDKITDLTIDRRRDPEKTKRDIQRDKIKCSKDQEARVFQEQLKVAETGLVPPGTELDVVLKSDKYNSKPDKGKETKKKEAEYKNDKSTEKRKADKPLRSRSRKRSLSHDQNSHGHRYHGPRRSMDRSHLARNRSFSPKRRRCDSRSHIDERIRRDREYRERNRDENLRFHLREKRDRYIKDLSPVSDRRMSRSPSIFNISPASMLSEREEWLTKGRYSRNRYSRSCSPISSNSVSERTGSPGRRSKRYSFMKEIQIKLQKNPTKSSHHNESKFNNVRTNDFCTEQIQLQSQQYFPPQPVMNVAFPTDQLGTMFSGPPSMCPAPDPFLHPMPVGQLGSNLMPTLSMPDMNAPMMMGMHQHMVQPDTGFPLQSASNSLFGQPQNQIPQQNIISFQSSSNLNDCANDETKEIAKLFEDKKISLSDFLSVSAKPIDSSMPDSIHNKIKVIARCQEAIKALKPEAKLAGRFFPQLTLTDSEPGTPIEQSVSKYQSPMRKVPAVRFKYTIPQKMRKGQARVTGSGLSVCVFLDKLLTVLDLKDPIQNLQEKKQKQLATAVLPKVGSTSVQPGLLIKKSTVAKQMEPVKCQICEIRSARKHSDTSCQTINKLTIDASTQVSVEDLNKSCTTFTPRGILKNNPSMVQSISHLTPAQLLAQLEIEKKEELLSNTWSNMGKKETFPIGRSHGESFAGQYFSSNNCRPSLGSAKVGNFMYSDFPSRSVGSYSGMGDSFKGGGTNSTSSGMYGNIDTLQSNKSAGDRFGSSFNSGLSSSPFGNNMGNKLDNMRNEFSGDLGRNQELSQYSFTEQNNNRNFVENPFDPDRRFSDSGTMINTINNSSTSGNWIPVSSKDAPLNKTPFRGTSFPKKFFNQRGNN